MVSSTLLSLLLHACKPAAEPDQFKGTSIAKPSINDNLGFRQRNSRKAINVMNHILACLMFTSEGESHHNHPNLDTTKDKNPCSCLWLRLCDQDNRSLGWSWPILCSLSVLELQGIVLSSSHAMISENTRSMFSCGSPDVSACHIPG